MATPLRTKTALVVTSKGTTHATVRSPSPVKDGQRSPVDSPPRAQSPEHPASLKQEIARLNGENGRLKDEVEFLRSKPEPVIDEGKRGEEIRQLRAELAQARKDNAGLYAALKEKRLIAAPEGVGLPRNNNGFKLAGPRQQSELERLVRLEAVLPRGVILRQLNESARSDSSFDSLA